MRTWRVVLKIAAYYCVSCVLLAIPLGELPFHTIFNPVDNLQVVQSSSSKFGAGFEDVSIISVDGIRLAGWVARPAHASGNAVILLHGVGDSRQGMVGFARLFLSQGYMVLLPDSRGHGTSGGFPTYGIREAGDVRRWVDWLNRNEKPRCVFGMGESMGAAILLQATKDVPLCAVVAESPFASFREIAYIRVGRFFNAGDWVGRIALRPAVEIAFLYGWMTRGVQLAHASPALSVVGGHVPILLIHGLADTNIPFQQSEMILAHNPSYITLWEVPGAGHIGASRIAGQEFDARVLNWFASHAAEIREQANQPRN